MVTCSEYIFPFCCEMDLTLQLIISLFSLMVCKLLANVKVPSPPGSFCLFNLLFCHMPYLPPTSDLLYSFRSLLLCTCFCPFFLPRWHLLHYLVYYLFQDSIYYTVIVCELTCFLFKTGWGVIVPALYFPNI